MRYKRPTKTIVKPKPLSLLGSLLVAGLDHIQASLRIQNIRALIDEGNAGGAPQPALVWAIKEALFAVRKDPGQAHALLTVLASVGPELVASTQDYFLRGRGNHEA